MKTFKTTVKSFLSGLLCLALSAPALTSCYDDTALWAEIEDLSGKIDDLESKLNGQIQAFNDLVAGGNLLIKSLQKQSDGSYVVTLSNGTTFGVLPTGISVKGLLSYKEVEGVKYWAMYNTNGDLELLVGTSGNYIPVESVVPTVKEKDGKFYLVVGDKEYETGFSADSALSVITGYELNKDESGNVYSVTFTFGEDGHTYTIPVDGYLGFSFRLGSAGNSYVIKDYYVDFGSTGQILAGMDGVEDYVLQVPEGWRVEEEIDELMGETYLDITAPSKAKVEAGDAVAEGNLKVVAVVEGGKAMAARLYLTTSPFKTFTATSSNAVIDIRTGVDKYIYGVSDYPYDADAVFAEAQALLKANDKGVATTGINMPLAEVKGSALASGSKYVLWAMPAFYDYSDESTGYSLKEGTASTFEFTYNNVKVEKVSVTYNDAVVKVDLGGAPAFYGGTALKSDELFDDILTQINNDVINSYSTPLTYEGSAFNFPVASVLEPTPETTYVTWVVPAVDGKTSYIKEDIVYVEYTLSGITSGGSVNVTAGTPAVTRTSISVPLSADGANSILYVYMKSTYAGRYSSDTQRADLLLESKDAKTVHAASADAVIEKLAPESKMTMFAMAIDKDGKYGKPVAVEAVTDAMKYNGLTVTLGEPEVTAKSAEVAVSVTGGDATGYIWWFGKEESDTFWTSSETCGKSKETGQQYMALYPEDSNIVRAMNNSSLENGVLEMNELTGDTQYVLMVLAKDKSGEYSVAGFVRFKTLAANLGTVVKAGSDTWTAAKEQVVIKWHENKFRKAANSNMSAYYAFDISVPKDLTAYILCISDDYFDQNPDIRKETDKILDIEAQCSRKYDAGIVVEDASGNKLTEPDWVDDAGETHTGTLMNVYNFYVHGYPTNGFATYFAAGSHGEGNCTAWEDGSCYNYNYALNSITKRHTVDYFIEYVKNTRGNYCKTDATINKVANDLFEAYYPYYKDAQPLIYENNGEPLYMEQHYAIGTNDSGKVVDDVYVVFVDKSGNYYEPMSFEVPNYFK